MSRHHQPRRLAARAAATLIAALAVLAIPSPIAAHAELDSITPADRSTVSPPSSIVAVFTEQLDPAKSSLALVDASGAVIAKGGVVDPNQTLTLTLDPATIAPGAYTVRWTSASAADGDLDHGTTTFTVAAAPSPSPTIASSAPPSAPGSMSPSIAPSIPSVAPSPSTPPAVPTSSSSDAVIPIVVALLVLAALGLWLLRGRTRAGR